VLDYIPTYTIILVIVYEHNGNVLLECKEHLVNNMPFPDTVMSSSKLFLSDVLSIPENSSDGDQCGVVHFDAVALLRSVF
jgi:hypothetical protein